MMECELWFAPNTATETEDVWHDGYKESRSPYAAAIPGIPASIKRYMARD